MNKIKLTALLLSVCMLLCACMQPSGGNDGPASDDPTLSGDQNSNSTDSGSSSSDNGESTDDKEKIPYPADLTIELVVEWEMADIILSILDDLSDLFRDAMKEVGCQIDSVTLTMSTAGAYTADSLIDGGIDAAILPSVDIISAEHRVSILALSDDAIPMTAIAVSKADSDLSEEFCVLLFSALTETEAGQDFLAAICGESVFSAPTEDALQAVRDYLKELMDEEGEHEV